MHLSLDANILEDEVEHVMSHLANDKSPGWDGLTHELFKKYVIKLREKYQDTPGSSSIYQNAPESSNYPYIKKIRFIK